MTPFIATGKVITSVSVGSKKDVDIAVAAAKKVRFEIQLDFFNHLSFV